MIESRISPAFCANTPEPPASVPAAAAPRWRARREMPCFITYLPCKDWIRTWPGYEAQLRSMRQVYSNPESFSASSHFTILPTSCARSRGQSSSASSVSTTTRSRTPIAATNFLGLQKKFPRASSAINFPAETFSSDFRASNSYTAAHDPISSSRLPRAGQTRWAPLPVASPVRGWRSPRKYFQAADKYARVNARSAVCRFRRPGASGHHVFSAGISRGSRGTLRRARRTFPRSSNSVRRPHIFEPPAAPAFLQNAVRINRRSVGVHGLAGRAFDVSETCFGPRRRDTQHHQRSRRRARVARLARSSRGRGFRDVVIGGQHGHQRVVFLAHAVVQQVRCGQADRGGGVSSRGFREDVRRRYARQLLAYSGGLFGVGDHPLARRRKQRREARGGLLQHGVAADDVQQLFRSSRAAARPETSAAASGKNYGVRCEGSLGFDPFSRVHHARPLRFLNAFIGQPLDQAVRSGT